VDPNIDLGALADDAAQVVVKGVVSSAAVALRDRLARLFTRGDTEQEERSAELRRLDETSTELEAAANEDRDALSQRLVLSWRRRLMVFLEDHPDAAEELHRIVAEFSPDKGSTRTGSMSATGGDNSVVILSGRDTRLEGGLQR
jgi:hypothetical protein